MPKLLITGSAGFLGANAYTWLRRQGHNVTGVDIEPGPTVDHWMDVRKFTRVMNVDYDAILHFAAFVKGRDNIENQFVQMMSNVDIDTAVIDYATRHTGHLVYPSSSAVYPVMYQGEEPVKLTESMVDLSTTTLGMPDHIYGWTKLSAERLLYEVHRNSKLKITVFRPFSGYGPGQTTDYPVPNLVKMIMAGPDQVTVWGNGEQTRDFVYVTDIMRCLDWSLVHDHDYLSLNIGSGAATSFRSVIETAHLHCYGRKPAHINTLMDKPVGVTNRVADITQLTQLGLRPDISLEQGLGEFICHYTNS